MYSEEYERNDHMNTDGSEQVIEFTMLLWYSNVKVEALSCKI